MYYLQCICLKLYGNSMKKFFAISALVFCFANGYSQNETPQQRYEQFKRQANENFEFFRKKANEQYAAFLRQAWEQYKVLPAIPKPKDETVPPIVLPDNDKDKPIESNPIPIKDVVTPPAPNPQPVPISPIKEKTSPKEITVDISYCGTECRVRMDNTVKINLSDCSNDNLSEMWSKLSEDGVMNNTIRDCLYLRESKNLCDWAYLNLLSTFAKAVYEESNEATLLTSFIYCQSGYNMRLGRKDNRIYLLYASKHGIYDIAYFKINDTNYYPFECEQKQLEICNAPYPQEKPLSLLITNNQKFKYQASDTRTLTSKQYPDIQVLVQVNKNLIDFYNTYPTSEIDGNFMTRWTMYANTPLDEHVKEKLYPALMDKINGLSQLEAVNKLLNWVQTAFVYEYDDKVWGHDRAFFAEETLYYPYCDCEDRSILFTRLVRDLLRLKTILVFYPGHLASAVCFTDNVSGDYILLNGKHYVITDPTYIGAPVGMTMPDMDNTQAHVILLE